MDLNVSSYRIAFWKHVWIQSLTAKILSRAVPEHHVLHFFVPVRHRELSVGHFLHLSTRILAFYWLAGPGSCREVRGDNRTYSKGLLRGGRKRFLKDDVTRLKRRC